MTSLKDYPSQNNTPGVVLFILFWVGLGLLIAAMVLFDEVLMPVFIAVLLWILPGAIITPFLYNALPSKKLKGFGKAIMLLLVNTIAFGGIVLYIVLAMDYYDAKGSPVTTGRFPVVEYGYTTRSRGGGEKIPFANISYQNQIKRINFPGYAVGDTLNYHSVQLATTPGYLGFDIIKSKKLLK